MWPTKIHLKPEKVWKGILDTHNKTEFKTAACCLLLANRDVAPLGGCLTQRYGQDVHGFFKGRLPGSC